MRKQKLGVAAGAVVAVAAGVAAATALTGNAAASTTVSGGTYEGASHGAGRAGHEHTAVTGTELSKVKAAVKAKDSAITVHSARKDPDGSYDVFGTKSGQPVMLEVSKDLKTITSAGAGHGGRGGHGGPGGPGGAADTPVTGAEATKVAAAVKAKHADFVVSSVREDPDGSYDAVGTQGGQSVMYDVNKDLSTVSASHAGGPRSGNGEG